MLISSTSLVGKMLESIMRDKIVAYLERHSLIRDSQPFQEQKIMLVQFVDVL